MVGQPSNTASSRLTAMPPLSDLRVLDHGHVWAGPLLDLFLADLPSSPEALGGGYRGVTI